MEELTQIVNRCGATASLNGNPNGVHIIINPSAQSTSIP